MTNTVDIRLELSYDAARYFEFSEVAVDASQFGRNTKRKRKEIGISQEELALQAGLSRNYISMIERGEATNVTMRVITRIALVLGIKPSELVNSDDQDPSLIPPALRQLALADGLSYGTVDWLAHIPRRGQEPRSVDDWRDLLKALGPYLSDADSETDL